MNTMPPQITYDGFDSNSLEAGKAFTTTGPTVLLQTQQVARISEQELANSEAHAKLKAEYYRNPKFAHEH